MHNKKKICSRSSFPEWMKNYGSGDGYGYGFGGGDGSGYGYGSGNGYGNGYGNIPYGKVMVMK